MLIQPHLTCLMGILMVTIFLQVLCTTSTLAQGVNLPAHLVILKGTRRWVNEKGDVPGNREYDRSTILQMIGRAGRPQFNDEGVAVLMTQKEVQALLARPHAICLCDEVDILSGVTGQA